jgi:hypothetical protein
MVPVRLHHVEIWVLDLDRALTSFGWLLEKLVAINPPDAGEP